MWIFQRGKLDALFLDQSTQLVKLCTNLIRGCRVRPWTLLFLGIFFEPNAFLFRRVLTQYPCLARRRYLQHAYLFLALSMRKRSRLFLISPAFNLLFGQDAYCFGP